MDASGWTRLLKRNRYSVDPRCLHRFALISVCALGNTLLGRLQARWWSRRLAETEIVQPPLFVIGHWRSGTSLLHELLALDPHHVAPSTYQCVFPSHFLLTEPWLPKLIGFALPSHRPMDNMPMSWDGPLEDEFALCNLGEASPYLTIAFPNEPPQDCGGIESAAISGDVVARWQQALLRFMKQITVRQPNRIVLKSPPHTLRIRLLLDLFPDARFVHIVRDPFAVFPSTMNLWARLYRFQGLQSPTFAGLEDHVLENYVQLFDKLQESRPLLSSSRFHELRYEDLVREPVEQMRGVYERLDLGDFDRVIPFIEPYLKRMASYKTNRYELTPDQRAQITRRWGHVVRRYGYA